VARARLPDPYRNKKAITKSRKAAMNNLTESR